MGVRKARAPSRPHVQRKHRAFPGIRWRASYGEHGVGWGERGLSTFKASCAEQRGIGRPDMDSPGIRWARHIWSTVYVGLLVRGETPSRPHVQHKKGLADLMWTARGGRHRGVEQLRDLFHLLEYLLRDLLRVCERVDERERESACVRESV